MDYQMSYRYINKKERKRERHRLRRHTINKQVKHGLK